MLSYFEHIYTVIQAVHSLLYIVAKCHFFSVVTWKDIIKCEGGVLTSVRYCIYFNHLSWTYDHCLPGQAFRGAFWTRVIRSWVPCLKSGGVPASGAGLPSSTSRPGEPAGQIHRRHLSCSHLLHQHGFKGDIRCPSYDSLGSLWKVYNMLLNFSKIV